MKKFNEKYALHNLSESLGGSRTCHDNAFTRGTEKIGILRRQSKYIKGAKEMGIMVKCCASTANQCLCSILFDVFIPPATDTQC